MTLSNNTYRGIETRRKAVVILEHAIARIGAYDAEGWLTNECDHDAVHTLRNAKWSLEAMDSPAVNRFWTQERLKYDDMVMADTLTHYIAMSGSHGCLPDSCNAYTTYDDAVNALVELFELGRTRKARLYANRYLELGTCIVAHGSLDDLSDSAEYCEIQSCQCASPWEHCDAGDDPMDWPDYPQSA